MNDPIDIDDYTLPQYIVMHLISKSPKSCSAIIREAIDKFGDMIEHGPYIYGEYSDEIDEGTKALIYEGIAQYVGDQWRSIELTDYGRKFYDEFVNGGEFEDEEWEKARRRMVE